MKDRENKLKKIEWFLVIFNPFVVLWVLCSIYNALPQSLFNHWKTAIAGTIAIISFFYVGMSIVIFVQFLERNGKL